MKSRSPKINQESQKDTSDESTGEPAGNDHNPGRGLYRRQLEQFAKLNDSDKHKMLKETWKELAMGAALRAKQMVATCSAKDFGRLYQMVMTGAVSIDKAYPKQEQLNSPSLIVNMFGTLGQRAAKIAMPDTPETITVEAKEVPCPALDTKTILSLPTMIVETSPTMKPSPELLSLPSETSKPLSGNS